MHLSWSKKISLRPNSPLERAASSPDAERLWPWAGGTADREVWDCAVFGIPRPRWREDVWGLYTWNAASSKLLLKQNTKAFSETPDPWKQNAAGSWELPDVPGFPERGARGERPTWGEAGQDGGRPGRLQHRRPGTGRRRGSGKGVSRRDPNARRPGQPGPLSEGSLAASCAAGIAGGVWGRECRAGWLGRSFPVVSSLTEVRTGDPKAARRPAEPRAVGGVPRRAARPLGARGGERGRLLPPSVRPEPAARSTSWPLWAWGEGSCLGARKGLRDWLATAPASGRPQRQSPRRVRTGGREGTHGGRARDPRPGSRRGGVGERFPRGRERVGSTRRGGAPRPGGGVAPLSSAKMPAAPRGLERGKFPPARKAGVGLTPAAASARGQGAEPGPFPGSRRWVGGAGDLGLAREPTLRGWGTSRAEAFNFLSSRLFLGVFSNYESPWLAAKLNQPE